ncbi:tRNA guanosine(34) transglycosylase Tgt [bacterium]|nr:tRNA guanosine(34) transglycosylase Tgt [bacterium]
MSAVAQQSDGLVAAAPRPSPLTIHHRDAQSAARAGVLQTAHGAIETPTFMPVATQGTVKGITARQLRDAGARLILSNTYHLSLRPGVDTIEAMGGLHRFMGWDGAILTDSGGFQVMSLATLRKVTDEGVRFQSHLDGATLCFTPEDVVGRQHRFGVDVLMPLDELVPAGAPAATVVSAMRRTTDWAWRSSRVPIRPDRHLFAIVQGGFDAALRRDHAAQLAAGEFPGYAVGGLSVGEERGLTREVAAVTAAALPVERPRYLMGVGLPQDLLRLIGMGYDLFDCVLPTRNGRNATCFTAAGRVNMRLARHARDDQPIDPTCACEVCRSVSRAYVRHLCVAGEMLGAQLASLHNVCFYLDLMRQARAHVVAGDYAAWATVRAEAMDHAEDS